jgi:glycosyltransferase involved in cell wall biosynthesis
MSYKISIIVPMYNAESSIYRCIRSLHEQRLSPKEYEIIIVDDGSTDRSMNTVLQACKKYENIKVFHKSNRGASSARNYGIKHSSGEYIWFVDSDDTIHPNVVNSLYNNAKSNDLDILSFGYSYFKNNLSTEGNMCEKPKTIVSGLEYIKDYQIEHSVCFFIIKRNTIINNNVYFVEGKTKEDYEYTLKLFKYCKNIMHINAVCYNYIHRADSISRSVEYKQVETNIVHLIDIIVILDNQFPYNKSINDYNYYANQWINAYKYLAILNVIGFPLRLEDKLKMYNRLKKHKIFPKRKMKIYTTSIHKTLNLIFRIPMAYKTLLYLSVLKTCYEKQRILCINK